MLGTVHVDRGYAPTCHPDYLVEWRLLHPYYRILACLDELALFAVARPLPADSHTSTSPRISSYASPACSLFAFAIRSRILQYA